MHCNQLRAIVGQVKNAHRSKVVDLEGFADWVIEVDARSTVKNDLNF